nr:hypothetical protein D3W47_10095 [Deinococcus sp. RM]
MNGQVRFTPTPIRLALDLLATVPQPIRRRFDVCVLQGSGFESATFLQGVRDEGFEFVVDVRSNRCTDHPGRVTVSDCEHGSWLSLHNCPWEVVTLARFNRGARVFFSVSSELLSGDEVAREGKRRWAIESFMGESKHQFGLNQFALHTAQGLDRWGLLVCAAFTLTVLCTGGGKTLQEDARLAAQIARPALVMVRLMIKVRRHEEFLRQHGYSVYLSRCRI